MKQKKDLKNVVKKKENSENHFKTEEPQEMLEWKDILGRKFKGEVVNIISTLGVEMQTSP